MPDSRILSFDQKKQLFDLIKFDTKTTKLKLLYRGSRDGFAKNDSHPCHDISNALIMIETTQGYIFGAHSNYDWSNEIWDAFFFSLVNKLNRPFLNEYSKDYEEPCCCYDVGLFFVHTDDSHILIENNCDESVNSSARLQSPILKDPNNSNGECFVENFHFQVKEIEIFQVENFMCQPGRGSD